MSAKPRKAAMLFYATGIRKRAVEGAGRKERDLDLEMANT
jgi:hypothetical protein